MEERRVKNKGDIQTRMWQHQAEHCCYCIRVRKFLGHTFIVLLLPNPNSAGLVLKDFSPKCISCALWYVAVSSLCQCREGSLHRTDVFVMKARGNRYHPSTPCVCSTSRTLLHTAAHLTLPVLPWRQPRIPRLCYCGDRPRALYLSQNVEHPPCDLPDVSGFQYMREGKVGAQKIVYRDIQDISTLESLKGCWRWITYPSGETRLAASWPPELGQDTTSLDHYTHRSTRCFVTCY
ncbi:hypothetical protein BGW80DRAFT_288060 [Lactifluus volemus]|nr:hypothetical protein BGW80DRAFT_288060 [Lactifluus volemus]